MLLFEIFLVVGVISLSDSVSIAVTVGILLL